MLVNLTDVLTTEGRTEEKQVALEADVFCYQGKEYWTLVADQEETQNILLRQVLKL